MATAAARTSWAMSECVTDSKSCTRCGASLLCSAKSIILCLWQRHAARVRAAGTVIRVRIYGFRLRRCSTKKKIFTAFATY